ncbi:helix-turn-helix domain-containing protein [Rhizobium giardinii]|uniref:helix-turn-helix domain-containing protein n=1 Tax=Rhizobium giardinii TaxID=56731 RepID=UPI003D6F7207
MRPNLAQTVLPEPTLRENLAHLVTAGMIHRKDSPNGKRYARKDRAGTVEEAFGISLARRSSHEELARLAQQVAAERMQLKIVKEKLLLAGAISARYSQLPWKKVHRVTGENSRWGHFPDREGSSPRGVGRHPGRIVDASRRITQRAGNSVERGSFRLDRC